MSSSSGSLYPYLYPDMEHPMTDDSTVTPGGYMNGALPVAIVIRSDLDGHWVE